MIADKFKDCLKHAVRQFQELDKLETIRVISHLDADGISACSILLKTLQKQHRNYLISILNQLNKESLRSLSQENYKIYIFTDLGSSQLSLIEKYLPGRTVLILDHHYPEKEKGSFIQLNPHLCGIDGSNEISGAGVVYLFCKELDSGIKLAHLAVIGAIGDMQEQDGFKGLNQQILEDAVAQGLLKVSKGLKLFGRQTRPLYKLLEYSSDFKIPGISGSEQESIAFLNSIGIKAFGSKQWRKIIDLSEDEHKRLVESIIIKRADEKNPEAIIGPIYSLIEEQPGTPLRDAKEFATLLNACGRLKKASLGIGVCIGNERIKRKAAAHVKNYKKTIVKSMQWYRQNQNSEHISKEDNYLILNAENNISPTIIGTIASIISKSGEYKDGTYIMALARDHDCKTKVSVRMSGQTGARLVDFIKSIVDSTGGEAGGHSNAAGALIDTERENEFIERAKKYFKACS